MMKLEVSGLSFSYDNKKLFENLDFSIKEGEFVSLLGPSGCGKSTILKLLTGVIQAETGRITVDGQPVTGLSEHFAYMPQNDLLFPWKTILDNVCLYGQIHGSMEEMRREASKNFPAFGLEGYETKYPSSLSGGMRQRAAFLRTALCKADILSFFIHSVLVIINGQIAGHKQAARRPILIKTGRAGMADCRADSGQQL